MPKCLIVYFSQGGTTERVAQAIARGLNSAEYSADLCNLRHGEPQDPAYYDLIGIGSPVYGYSLPFNVADYLASLPEAVGMPGFSFLLHGTYAFDAGNRLRQALSNKGIKEDGYFHCHGYDSFLGYLRQGFLFSPEHPTPDELKQAESFGREVAAHAGGKEYTQPEYAAGAPFIYRLERFLTSRWFARNFHSWMFTVNKKSCNACGLCAKLCPSGNIEADNQGHLVWGRNCLFCLTCEMKCPLEAIKSTLDWIIFRPFMRHNVSQAASDPTLDHVIVRHQRGKTEII